MRRRQLKWLWARLGKLSSMKLTRDALLMKLGSAQSKVPAAWRLVDVGSPSRVQALPTGSIGQARTGAPARRSLSAAHQPHRVRSGQAVAATICSWSRSRRRSRTLKGDLAIRPIFHQREPRIEAHIFIAFLAYCLHVTLGQQLKAFAPGLTPRSVLEKFAAVQMIDVHVPTTDGRELTLHALYAARARTEAAARQTQAHAASPVAAQNQRRCPRRCSARCSADLAGCAHDGSVT